MSTAACNNYDYKNRFQFYCPKLADVIEELHINFKYHVKI
jgi:hypothetical protein